jgi:hypothetical protein
MSDGSQPLQQPAPTGRERRASERFTPADVPWIESIKTSVNEEAQLLDISRTGMLVDTRGPLQPGRKRIVWIAMSHAQIRTDVLVLRSVLTRIDPNGKAIYRSALLFSEPVDLRLPDRGEAQRPAVVDRVIPAEDAPLAASSPLELAGPVESLWATETGSEVAVSSRITENGCIVETCVLPAIDQIASLSVLFSPARRLTLTGRVVELIDDRACLFRFSNLTTHIQRALRVEIRCGTKPHTLTTLALARAASLEMPFEPLIDAAVGGLLQANHW